VPLTRFEFNLYAPTIETDTLEALPPSANTTGVVSTVYMLLAGAPLESKFVDEWAKYNPSYISSRDHLFVESTVGIKSLNRLIDDRVKARIKKNFKESDRIRDYLASRGFVLKDTQGRPTWEVALDARIDPAWTPTLPRRARFYNWAVRKIAKPASLVIHVVRFISGMAR
jgi:hypothetical protein